MKFLNLVINECIKIFKKKSTLIFLMISILSLFASYAIVQMQIESKIESDFSKSSHVYTQEKINKYKKEYESASEDKKKQLLIQIEVNELAIENDIYLDNNFNNFRRDLIYELENEMKILNVIDKNSMKNEYIKQKVKVDRIKKIIENNDFEEYIKYNKDNLKYNYDNKLITLEEYNLQIKKQNEALKYEFGKLSGYSLIWKQSLLNRNSEIDSLIIDRVDVTKKEYFSDKKIEELENEKKFNLYRLENNMPMLNEVVSSDIPVNLYYMENTNSYYRSNYFDISITVSMFIIAILFIILASGSISEEISKGTIKFLIVTPFKRYKILLSKLIAFIITLLIITVILSQVNYLLGNILFNGATNEYVYIENSVVKVMSTNVYETLQFLLKAPEVIIYILAAMTISVLSRNTIISNTITLVIYIASNFLSYIISSSSSSMFDIILKLDFMKYLPITNFNLIDKILPTYEKVTNFIHINTSLNFSLIVISITAVALSMVMFESFNKKDI